MSHDFSRRPEWQQEAALICRSSTLQSASGVPYLLQVAVPEGDVPEGGFPAVVVLDGGHHFTGFAAMARRLAQRSDVTGVARQVIIGVESVPAHARRGVDFSPWGEKEGKGRKDGGPVPGGAAFAEFLETVALPAVGAEVRLDPARLSLAAHSLAGYFALYLAAARPGLFSSIGSFSPSLWWDAARIETALRASQLEETRFLISVGSREQDGRRLERRMVDHARELATVLESCAKEVRFILTQGEDHASSPFVTFPAFLRFLGKD